MRQHIPEPNPDSFIQHPSQAKAGFWPLSDKLHVICSIVNPQRARSRYELYRAFEKRCHDAGAELHVAEIAFGARHHEITEPDNPNHLQLRIFMQELWHKENAQNLLIADVIRRHPDAKYFACIDADVQFQRADWAQETMQQLQHYHVVQMFSHCQDLSIDHEPLNYDDGGEHLPGMVYQHIQAGLYGRNAGIVHSALEPYGPAGLTRAQAMRFHPGHCGYAWGYTRHALDTLGGLIDWSACGANDHHMARGLLGDIAQSVHGGSSPAFKNSLQIWAARAEVLKPKIGYVPGLLTHYWHGPKTNRQYLTRWQILNRSQFNPCVDLKRDAQGLYQLTGRDKQLIADLMAYFRQRNEDSTC
jgi:hypothetical protein